MDFELFEKINNISIMQIDGNKPIRVANFYDCNIVENDKVDKTNIVENDTIRKFLDLKGEYECTFSMSNPFCNCNFNKELFEKLCGSYTPGSTFKLIIPCTVQRRKHRKKRINKKWAKRYGFKTYYKELDTKIDSVSENGEWSFTC